MLLPYVMFAVAGLGVLLLFAVLVLNRSPAPVGTDGKATLAGRPTKLETEKQSSAEKLRERLIHAGLYKKNSPTLFYMMQMTFMAIPFLMCLLGYRIGMLSMLGALTGGGIFGILGVVGPGLWLDYRKSARQTNIRRAIPDALDVITICVEAGLSLNSAIVRVSKDLASTHALLATELVIVHRQIQLGKTAGEALRNFAERFDLAELRSLASVVAQSDRFGASIATALRSHGENLRKKRMLLAHERAQKAAVWILLPTVICIFPALFVVILGPAAYDISEMLQNVGK
jgi:tight adherence protein C